MADSRSSDLQTLLKDIDELSRTFIVRFYRSDDQWCTAHCMPDITCLGSTHDMLFEGDNGFRYIMTHHVNQLNPRLVMSMNTKVRPVPGGQSVLVLTDFCLISDPTSGDVQTIKKRATLLWVLTNDGPRLQHIQFTAPHYSPSSNTVMANDGAETYIYANTLLEQVIRRAAVPLRDVKGTIWSIGAAEIRYIEANKQHCILHCMDHDIVVRRGFADLVKLFSEVLIPVHRSFAVNPAHVRSASHATIILDDDTHIPIPQRRAKEVRDQIGQAIHKIALLQAEQEIPLTVVDRRTWPSRAV